MYLDKAFLPCMAVPSGLSSDLGAAADTESKHAAAAVVESRASLQRLPAKAIAMKRRECDGKFCNACMQVDAMLPMFDVREWTN